MQQAIERRPHFIRRMFTDAERAYCERTARPAEHYAARFAAREAIAKKAAEVRAAAKGATEK